MCVVGGVRVYMCVDIERGVSVSVRSESVASEDV